MPVVIVGHVDHGKSTLVGQILHASGSLPAGRYEAVQQICEDQGKEFELAFLLDSLAEEQAQGITIEATEVRFALGERQYAIIDAPGHKEFLKNMISGASRADAALLLIDVSEGVMEQSRRHGRILQLLGIRQIAVVCNKLDLMGWDRGRFEAVRSEYSDFLESLGISAKCFIPISAKFGDNVLERSRRTPWYQGPTIGGALASFESREARDHSLRLPVQDVYKFGARRLIAGRIESGSLNVGDEITFWPARKRVRIKSIETWSLSGSEPPQRAGAGESVALALSEQIFVERGDVITLSSEAPPLTQVFRASVFWMGAKPLRARDRLKLKLTTQEQACEVVSVDQVLRSDTLEAGSPGDGIGSYDVGTVTLRTHRPIIADRHDSLGRTGRFVLVAEGELCGGGIVLDPSPGIDLHERARPSSAHIHWEAGKVQRADREKAYGHKGAVIWLTGLSGAGKSTIAREVENELFARKAVTYRLDGDNLRHGLCSDLGFSRKDRAENIRRAGETAALFADAGLIVLAAFISPHRAERRLARRAAGKVPFIEVFVDCPISVCESRDENHRELYAKARAGEIQEFTGISAPYEEPLKPEIHLRTDQASVSEIVTTILDHLKKREIL